MEEKTLKRRTSLVVIGGSAGSLEVVLAVLPELQPGLKFPIVLVLHRKSDGEGGMASLLAAITKTPVREVEDKDLLEAGTIYLVPADYHLLFEQDNVLSLDASEKVNFSRPSIDVTFESAADVFGRDVVGLLLSGANSDGTAGLISIRNAGGIVLVQEPSSAGVAYMPQQALNELTPDRLLHPSEIASFINVLSTNQPFNQIV